MNTDIKEIKQVETFPEMVKRLFKEMGTPAATLIHAAVGITGEVAELKNAILNKDQENIPEELGDMRFYMQQIMNQFNWVFAQFNNNSYAPRQDRSLDDTLVVQAGEVQDLLKKSWVYNKPLDKALLHEEFGKLFGAYLSLTTHFGYTDEDICAQNMYKLSTGPNARFPLGYTDAAAIARADKKPGL